MNGAIFYSGKYGSTEQYAKWIGEASGLPVFSIADPNADPLQYDFLLLGSSVVYFKLTIRHWIKANLTQLEDRAKVLFSVSGAGPSPKLERWVTTSLPPGLASKIDHIALRGRLDHKKVSWGVKLMLFIASVFNRDAEASKDERYGFDYVDKNSIEPILQLINKIQQDGQED